MTVSNRLQCWQGAIRASRLTRYLKNAAAYSRFFDFLIAEKKSSEAERLTSRYEKAFPRDKVFPRPAWIGSKRYT